mmetsp:Transcript_5184/g.16681  ORF Transcript_5184/g.16681 Transcript_5184/m.16681 type:complete len:99 (-) Transcript_5184:820-1116(-)|eukprot:CAMPEP_0170740384 /NCGR_PEP_ID=MMETSP0437-20130122/5654_1 /TAXON_ID=0 /ORGANISM="Sexangularia sp." /LENGTH=98 /DNA_ID=CAMNT_0011078879 /DNA_START=71 /DNA_END=367 /DNA_ORIENTATION=+
MVFGKDNKGSSFDFTVEYSHNCDGGKQEFGAAVEGIRRVVPDAKIEEVRLNKYPIRVRILDSAGEPLFETDQRNLFSKYASKRAASLDEIEKILAARY